jgi:hypothetical protein
MPSDTLKKKTEWTESPGIPGILYKLVGGWPTPEKYESQWEGWSHMKWKIIQMFETTNQRLIYHLEVS